MSDQTVERPARPGPDRRVERTRAAIRTAMSHLVLTRGYDAFSAADIAEAANIGRSTFYEHYQSKDDAFARSVEVVLGPLARACATEAADPALDATLSHFWEYRRLVRIMLSGRPRAIMVDVLARLIVAHLATAPAGQNAGSAGENPLIPLLAAQIAHGQLALVEAWLSGRHGCAAGQIARMLRATSHATAKAGMGRCEDFG